MIILTDLNFAALPLPNELKHALLETHAWLLFDEESWCSDVRWFLAIVR